ncbi:MAG: polysaccharide biosynthesis/export family protein [Deltaproteobacteria bacterium]|nr:polysaccharide biosynthesis/export family protein [Deltaproteobacteria bacterium]
MVNQNTIQIGVRSRTSQCGQILRGAAAIISGVVTAAAFGCSSPHLAPSPVVVTPPTYRVSAPDSLTITILPEPTLISSVKVRPDGVITVPLIGEVMARGRTIPEIAAEIEDRIARYKRDPHVSVALIAAASTDIVILGEVGRQGAFPLVKETRIVEAIGMVGGTSAFGSDRKIRVIRTVDGVTTLLRVNLHEIRKGDLSTNLMLQPGDIVYVPPTLWARFGYALNTLLFPLQPIMGLARTMGGNLITP